MKSIIQKLESVQQPWNCPHGRPTIRHLVDIDNYLISSTTTTTTTISTISSDSSY